MTKITTLETQKVEFSINEFRTYVDSENKIISQKLDVEFSPNKASIDALFKWILENVKVSQ